MSKMETTNKVSLKLPSMIKLGRRGAHAPSSQLWTQPTHTHTNTGSLDSAKDKTWRQVQPQNMAYPMYKALTK